MMLVLEGQLPVLIQNIDQRRSGSQKNVSTVTDLI